MGAEKKIQWGAAAAMFLLFGLLALVTHLAAPIGAVWKVQPGIDGSNLLGMAGNLMTFAAYLFMGIPSGWMLANIGYKRTALAALLIGVGGTAIQILSGRILEGVTAGGVPASFVVYLGGTFICGFSCCMLNIVINTMLNTLGDGGKRGNQLICFGGGVNSIVSTFAPMAVMLLVGTITAETSFRDVEKLLWWVLGIFAFAFTAFLYVKIPEPAAERIEVGGKAGILSPLKFRHTALGLIGVGCYIGIEIGVPGMLNLWMLDPKGAFEAVTPATAGSVTGMFFFLMLVGRFSGSWIGGKVSSRTILMVCGIAACALIVSGPMLMGITVPMAVFTGSGFKMAHVPLGTSMLALVGLFASVSWPAVYNLTVKDLGKHTEAASGLVMTMLTCGGFVPLAMGWMADHVGYAASYALPAMGAAYLALYAIRGCLVDPAGLEPTTRRL